jgi:hypothetical protein
VKRNLANFALFYAGWFVCVQYQGWVALGAVVLITVIQRLDWKLIAGAFVLGGVTDTFIEQAGLLSYAGGPRFGFLCPLWIWCLWGLFATTLTRSLAWLQDRPGLAFALGGIAGPLTYWVASNMGAVEMTSAGYLAIAIEFAIYTPLLLDPPRILVVQRSTQ